jgi:hypothetical protein
MAFPARMPHGCAEKCAACWGESVEKLPAIAVLALFAFNAPAEVVQIGVFSLFHPSELLVSPAATPLLVTTDGRRFILEGRQSHLIRLGRISSPLRVSARDGADADFRLSIPGKIERKFHGTLTVAAGDHKLIAVVTMDREFAVASVAAAEMPASTPLEALKAQAVVARSYYAAAGARHDGYEFCDTTHCQFLREPPRPESPAFRATEETRGLILAFNGKPVAALYSAACGGRTRSRSDLGSGYPYYSVPCDYCRRHTPGMVSGHQLGLCQNGAAGMAQAGASFREILEHYFPATSLKQISSNAIFFLPLEPPLRHSRDEQRLNVGAFQDHPLKARIVASALLAHLWNQAILDGGRTPLPYRTAGP